MGEFILLIIGLFLIVRAADILVNASSSLALRFNVPKMFSGTYDYGFWYLCTGSSYFISKCSKW